MKHGEYRNIHIRYGFKHETYAHETYDDNALANISCMTSTRMNLVDGPSHIFWQGDLMNIYSSPRGVD